MADLLKSTELLKKYKYLSIAEPNNCKLYTSLREMSRDIRVDYTTLSKKLKSNPELCSCQSKTTKQYYCIKKIEF